MRANIRTRFAPSPTGYLHLGHAYAAAQAFGFGGACLLRIEDIDHTRCRPDYQAAIFEDLSWLRFSWPEPVRIQSQHRPEYDRVIESLRARGLVYRCFKTRKDLPAGLLRSGPLPEPEIRARVSDNLPFAWRLWMDRCEALISAPLTYTETGFNSGTHTVDLSQIGDETLARKDIGTSYHIACCHDDDLQGITHVVRGVDIAPLTPLHRLLQHLMDWPVPIYHHHSLLKNKDGDKLAKRNKDTSIHALRNQGFTAAQVLDMATP